jgi:Glycosyltransferase family 87
MSPRETRTPPDAFSTDLDVEQATGGRRSWDLSQPPTIHSMAPVRRYAMAATVGVAAVAAATAFGNPILGHDDYWMRAIANGGYTGEPSERLIFMNTLLGWLLRGGYSLFPNVEWYALLLYGLIALSIAAVTYVSMQKPTTVHIAVVFLGLYFASRSLIVLSWTETALLAVGAGLILAICAPVSRGPAILAGLLIGIGFMVRMESLGAVLAIIPVLWIVRERWRHFGFIAFVAAGAILPAHIYDRAHYTTNSEWDEWSDFEEYRRNLHGTPKVTMDDDMDAILASIDWSRNDLDVFLNWYYADENVYTTESIKSLHEARRSSTAEPIENLGEVTERHKGSFAVIALTLVLAGASRWWIAAASAAWLLGLFTSMEILYRSRARVEMAMILTVALILVLLLHDRIWPLRRLFSLGILLALTALTLPHLVELRSAASDARARHASEMITLEQFDRRAVYIQVGSGLTLHGVSPFDDEEPPVTLVLTGWAVRSPHFALHLRQAGIDDLYLDPIQRAGIFLLGSGPKVANVVAFVEEHRNKVVAMEPVLNMGNGLWVWELTESA